VKGEGYAGAFETEAWQTVNNARQFAIDGVYCTGWMNSTFVPLDTVATLADSSGLVGSSPFTAITQRLAKKDVESLPCTTNAASFVGLTAQKIAMPVTVLAKLLTSSE
jgi:hypothetical protein